MAYIGKKSWLSEIDNGYENNYGKEQSKKVNKLETKYLEETKKEAEKLSDDVEDAQITAIEDNVYDWDYAKTNFLELEKLPNYQKGEYEKSKEFIFINKTLRMIKYGVEGWKHSRAYNKYCGGNYKTDTPAKILENITKFIVSKVEDYALTYDDITQNADFLYNVWVAQYKCKKKNQKFRIDYIIWAATFKAIDSLNSSSSSNTNQSSSETANPGTNIDNANEFWYPGRDFENRNKFLDSHPININFITKLTFIHPNDSRLISKMKEQKMIWLNIKEIDKDLLDALLEEDSSIKELVFLNKNWVESLNIDLLKNYKNTAFNIDCIDADAKYAYALLKKLIDNEIKISFKSNEKLKDKYNTIKTHIEEEQKRIEEAKRKAEIEKEKKQLLADETAFRENGVDIINLPTLNEENSNQVLKKLFMNDSYNFITLLKNEAKIRTLDIKRENFNKQNKWKLDTKYNINKFNENMGKYLNVINFMDNKKQKKFIKYLKKLMKKGTFGYSKGRILSRFDFIMNNIPGPTKGIVKNMKDLAEKKLPE